jgi:hypothetical protein
MAERPGIEKFSMSELEKLRNELMQSAIDSWQAANVVSAFLTGRGYGVNSTTVRNTVASLDAFSSSAEAMQAALETVAYVM